MNTPMDLVTEIYQACDPTEALESNDPRYVPLAAARGDAFAEQGGWRRQIGKAIYQSKTPATCLVSGFLGDGKTTELKRLIREFDDPRNDRRLAAIYVDCEKYINPERYSFLDVLLAIVGETGKQLKDDFGVELKPGYWRTRFEEIRGLLTSEVAVESAEAKAAFDPFEFALNLTLRAKDEATMRRQLLKALEGENSSLAELFGSLLRDEARPELKKKGYDDIVIVVDWLEKLFPCKPEKESDPSAYVDLFIHHAPHFQRFGTHLVLTVPIDLVYSEEQERLTNAYGREPDVISAVKVIEYFQAEERQIALNAMGELLRKRFERVEGNAVSFDDVVPSGELAGELIEFSGGHPRQLLILIRQCLQFIDSLPITREAFEAAKKKEVQAASRKVPEHWFAKLAAVHATHRIDNDPEHLRMLRSLCVFAYANDEPVYAVDPAILQLKRMKEAIAARAGNV